MTLTSTPSSSAAQTRQIRQQAIQMKMLQNRGQDAVSLPQPCLRNIL